MKNKHIYIVLALAMFFVGCGNSETKIYVDGHRVITIDGCEYFKLSAYGIDEYTLTHKGNCKNPIHVYNKPTE